MVTAATLWALLSTASPDRINAVRSMAAAAEARRLRADYDTGSILESEALSLWALAEHIRARVVVEVGTFIGMSTEALAAASTVETVFTCDCSNDCLPRTDKILTFPRQTSTQMFRQVALLRPGAVDLCFFDGVLRDLDVLLLGGLTHKRTVYAFHDYNFGPKIRRRRDGSTFMETVPRKGIGNVMLLRPILPHHVLVEPLEPSTLALMVPEALL